MKPLINMQKDNFDPSYRYKMPPVEVKWEGSGNGKKTIIVNIKKISRSIQRNIDEIIKYIGQSANAKAKLMKGSNDWEYAVVSGYITDDTLQNIIYDYIEKYILCTMCGNPETFYMCKLSPMRVSKKCKACGNKEKINEDKITRYILNTFISDIKKQNKSLA